MDIVFHPRFMDHRQYAGHPERAERLSVVLGSLARSELDPPMHEPTPVDEELLLKVHHKDHLRDLDSVGEGYYDPDTYMTEDTLSIARLAAGASSMAVDVANENTAAFALVRPPGHHAGTMFGGGFCYLNNVAVAAERALEKAKRVAIIDLDVHHGNGTADIFRSREDVLYISTHQYGIFPGTGHIKEVGTDVGEGYTINIPFPAGTGDKTFMYAMDRLIMPVLERYDPSFVLVSIGVDAHYADQLANLGLTSEGYMALIGRTHEFARGGSRGIAYFLEGGYDLGALSEVVGNTIAIDEDRSVPMRLNDGYDNGVGRRIVDQAVGIHSIMWDI